MNRNLGRKTQSRDAGVLKVLMEAGGGGSGDMTKAVYDPDDDGKVVSAASADNAGLLDGIDSSRIVFGDNTTKSQNGGSMAVGIPSGFYAALDPTGQPFSEWWHWIRSTAAPQGLANDYSFTLASPYHSDRLYYRRAQANGLGGWHRILMEFDARIQLPMGGWRLAWPELGEYSGAAAISFREGQVDIADYSLVVPPYWAGRTWYLDTWWVSPGGSGAVTIGCELRRVAAGHYVASVTDYGTGGPGSLSNTTVVKGTFTLSTYSVIADQAVSLRLYRAGNSDALSVNAVLLAAALRVV